MDNSKERDTLSVIDTADGSMVNSSNVSSFEQEWEVKRAGTKYPLANKVTKTNIMDRIEAKVETASGIENNSRNGGTEPVDEGTKMILERLERDSREREERYHADAAGREKRYREDQKALESRSEIREERLNATVEGIRTDVRSDLKSFEGKLDKMEIKVDSTYKHISAISITTILALVAIAVTVWLDK